MLVSGFEAPNAFENATTGDDLQQGTAGAGAGAGAGDETQPQWFEEQLQPGLNWSFALNRQLLVRIKILNFWTQSVSESPKRVYIMGGGEGSTAREVLRHRSIDQVVMCDIDEMVVDFCRRHLQANEEAFQDARLQLVFSDAKVDMESRRGNEKFDVIIGDLADPLEGGPCNHLYTKSFYEDVVKPILDDQGIFVTQAGLAGVLTHTDIFTSIHNTLKHVFNYVIAYSAHVPSSSDTCGWVLASDQLLIFDVQEIEDRIRERIKAELRYLDGPHIASSTVLNKTVQASLLNETHIFTEETARFIHGSGIFDLQCKSSAA